MQDDNTKILGIDLGDVSSTFCFIGGDEKVQERGRVATKSGAMLKLVARLRPTRVVFEAGTHSPWLDRDLREAGQEVVVLNPRRLRAISDSIKKTDETDAQMLAMLGTFDRKRLWTVCHRGADSERLLRLLKVRHALVKQRTLLVNTIRGLLKSAGERLPKADADQVHTLLHLVPEELQDEFKPIFTMLEQLATQVEALDAKICAELETHPDAKRLTSVPGVGPIVALAFVAVLDDPERFKHSRQVGAFLGLTPRVDQSGNSDKQLRITKAGHMLLRSLLVQSAQCVLRTNTRDSAMKQWGAAIAERGGKAAKKRALIAVARKLATLLHHLWRTGQTFQAFPGAPLPNSPSSEPLTAAAA